jgi:hypothetical protein
MTTLIVVSNSEGVIGRCDAKCYNAKRPICECVCNRANHGVGLVKANKNTQAWFKNVALEKGQRATYQSSFFAGINEAETAGTAQETVSETI